MNHEDQIEVGHESLDYVMHTKALKHVILVKTSTVFTVFMILGTFLFMNVLVCLM